jgi:hypothetical protein
MDKNQKLLLLKILGWFLTGYLFVNLTLYVMGKIYHLIFWGSLAIIALFTIKILPMMRATIENSK